MPRRVLSLLLMAVLMALAACGGDDGEGAGDAQPSPTSAPPFEGGREPVEDTGAGDNFPTAVLVDVRAAGHEGFDRIVFEFRDSRPGYRVEYITLPVVACGSGNVVEVDGNALLQVRMTVAAAHDDAGEVTFGPQELTPGLLALGEAVLTCDFEGELTWVLGLDQEVDFVVSALPDPFRIVVDVAQP